MKGLVAVPVYNEAGNLSRIIEELKRRFPDENLLFIDDGSTDGSHELLAKSGVSYIRHPVNLGYEETLRTAMHQALLKDFYFVVFFDADGQHRVEDLEKIIRVYQMHGYDLILGSRYKGSDGYKLSLRLLGTKIFSMLSTAFAGTIITDATCGLKLISRAFLPVALKLPTEDMHTELIVGLARCGAHIHEEKIDVLPRKKGESMYHFYKGLLYPAKTFLCLLGELIFYKHLKPDRKEYSYEFTE